MKQSFLLDFEQTAEEKEVLKNYEDDFYPRTTETDPHQIANYLDGMFDSMVRMGVLNPDYFDGVIMGLCLVDLISEEERARMRARIDRMLEANNLEMVIQVKPNKADTKTKTRL